MTNSNRRIQPKTRKQARQLRKAQTPAEQKLWDVLRGRNLGGYKFRRQHQIGKFIVDFYCPAVRLVVELDGDVHSAKEASDALRTDWLENQGNMVIRFRNEQVLNELDAVAARILEICETGK